MKFIAAVAPGDTDYHGGKWAVHVVMLMAYMDGDVSITRVLEADFKCPIQRQPKN